MRISPPNCRRAALVVLPLCIGRHRWKVGWPLVAHGGMLHPWAGRMSMGGWHNLPWGMGSWLRGCPKQPQALSCQGLFPPTAWREASWFLFVPSPIKPKPL